MTDPLKDELVAALIAVRDSLMAVLQMRVHRMTAREFAASHQVERALVAVRMAELALAKAGA